MSWKIILGRFGEAIEREMARDGQVFYLYNRVDTIERKVEELQALVPDARIAYAHGQMTEVQLENTLFDFIEGQYDILVTTTIIETGVDIPNANTLFVEMRTTWAYLRCINYVVVWGVAIEWLCLFYVRTAKI